MTLTVAFNYGGRAEIVDAVKAIVADGVPRQQDRREGHPLATCTTRGCPTPTWSSARRGSTGISNFLLWELAYSELVFTDVLWPDFRREHLREAVREFQARDRRFGNTKGRRGPD